MVQTGNSPLKNSDCLPEGTILLLDASSILDRASLVVVQEDDKDILPDSAATYVA